MILKLNSNDVHQENDLGRLMKRMIADFSV